MLDDNGFIISEHIAIMQYICDKYAPGALAYPNDPQLRGLINHRLCFNMAYFYGPIAGYSLAPIFFDVSRRLSGIVFGFDIEFRFSILATRVE